MDDSVVTQRVASEEIDYPRAPMPFPGAVPFESLTGVHILLLDEDAASRTELTTILRYCGAIVSVAASEPEALTVLRLLRPDVIVVALPRRHRGELPFVTFLHTDPRLGRVPVLVIAWPGDTLFVSGMTIAQLDRPLDASEVCRAVTTVVMST
jgi:PleD family two-component response regulator